MYQIFIDFYNWARVDIGTPALKKSRFSCKDFKNPIKCELGCAIDECITKLRKRHELQYSLFEYHYTHGANMKRTSKNFNINVYEAEYLIHRFERELISMLYEKDILIY